MDELNLVEYDPGVGYDDDDDDDLDDIGALEDIGFSFKSLGKWAKRAVRAGIDPTYIARKLAKKAFGARRKSRGRRRPARRGRVAFGVPRVATALATPPVIQATPGVSPPALKYVPFGLGSGNMGVGITTLTLQQQPQLPLKCRKLTVAVGRNGASVATALVLITKFSIGVYDQFAGSGNVDSANFIANAEGATMNLSPAGPGINVTMAFLSTIGAGAGDSIDVSASFLAEVIAP